MFLNTPAHTVVCLLTFTTTVVCIYLLATSQALFSFHICMSPLPFPWKPDCKLLKGEGNGTPLQYSCLENPMDGGAWWAAVHGVAKSPTRLSDFTFTFHFYALEKEMATHSSVLAWRIPWTEKPGRLQSMGSHRVGQDWSDLAGSFNYNLTVFCCGYLLCLWQWIFQWSYLGILKTFRGFHMPIQIGISFCMLIWESTLQCIY